jgi:hypothetical protein
MGGADGRTHVHAICGHVPRACVRARADRDVSPPALGPDYPASYSLEQHEHVLRVFEERWGKSRWPLARSRRRTPDDPDVPELVCAAATKRASPDGNRLVPVGGEIDVRPCSDDPRPTLVMHRTEDTIVPIEHGSIWAPGFQAPSSWSSQAEETAGSTTTRNPFLPRSRSSSPESARPSRPIAFSLTVLFTTSSARPAGLRIGRPAVA